MDRRRFIGMVATGLLAALLTATFCAAAQSRASSYRLQRADQVIE